MKRKIYQKLVEWKNRKDKMPLILQGARQIGKTYIVNLFAANEYENYIYINFESSEKIESIFSDLDVDKIIKKIEIYANKNIIEGKTLLVFDEIQKFPKALTALKYFCENKKNVDVVATGSLLGIAVRKEEVSFPVGKVDMLKMYPMDFEEFLIAMGKQALLDMIKECYDENKKLDDIFHDEAINLYKTFLFTGGMPQVVNTYIDTKNVEIVKEKKKNILDGYISDMTKYNSKTDVGKTILVYKSIGECLAKENKKYMYSAIKKTARAKDYEVATEWIELAGIANKIKLVSQIKVPLEAYKENDYFKFYMNDVGLLSSMIKLELNEIMFSEEINDFKGGLTENYVFTQMIKNFDMYYYKDNNMEIDFIIKDNDGIIPIEVKSSEHIKSKSLDKYKDIYKPKYVIRISEKNFGFENNIKSVPLYAVFCIK